MTDSQQHPQITELSGERELVEALRRFHVQLYEEGKKMGLDAIGDGPLAWCHEGQRMWRVRTTEFYARMMRQGEASPVWRRLVHSRAQRNALPIAQVEANMIEERRVFTNPSKCSDLLRAAVAELTSPYAEDPTHVKVDSHVEELCVCDPSTYLRLASDRVAKLFSYLVVHAKDERGKMLTTMAAICDRIDSLVDAFAAEGGDARDVWKLHEALLGVNLQRYK